MSAFIIEEKELLKILAGNGLGEKQAAKLLREAREISPATGAEMLVPLGIPYERAFQFLNSAPPFVKPASPVSGRRILGLLFAVLTVLSVAVLFLGKRDGGTLIRLVGFGSLTWYFLRDREES